MTDVMREMIAQLMGQQRAEEEGRKLPPFDHHSVCRSYLQGCCPRELLSDTRLESMMSCRKMHEPAHKGEYNKAQEKRDLFYDVEAYEELEDAICIVDQEIRRLQDKVKRDAENNLDLTEQHRTQKIFEVNEQIGVALVQIEALGNEGRINESVELSRKVDELKKRKRELDTEMKGVYPAMLQRLRVCETCSAQLNVMDHETRLQDHYGGKMHLGMVQIREKYAEMKLFNFKNSIDERRTLKKLAEEKERSERRSQRGRSRSRERKRSRSREKKSHRSRSRSKSKSRSHKERRRSRSRERKSSRRDSSRERFSGQLGFFHWLFVFAMLAALYGLVVLLDLKMPDVKPANQYEHFSEMRARQFLTQIASLGPRPSGSEALEIHAFRIITEKINSLKEVVKRNDVNRIEMDIQRPTGCYDLKFLSVFTLCYHKVTNIVARIGPKKGPTDFSILINCHFDTLPDTPGATDNAVSCAIMMEILEVFAHLNEPLEHDILFLFNGAEENFLQASHGFIVNHPWRHSLRAFINLEGCGSGGRELLFQTGPGESWLIKTYLDNAPHPHCNVLGQEIFQLGIIPSDTDFRIFRDYGKISGFDIAYIRNGWVYHTEFDRPELIDIGAIQRSGDNILALSRALIRSPYLKQPANFNEGTKWVFLDVVGLFTIFYEMKLALIFNYTVLVLVLFRIYLHLFRNGDYSINVLLCASMNQFMAFGAILLNMTMSWYSMPELVFPLYIVPMMTAAFFAHARSAGKMELVNFV
uniref:FXNA-like protease n=1 Tax=Meloidogyne javanica TaxID=6303 RepID=A0A915MCF9_MELJA